MIAGPNYKRSDNEIRKYLFPDGYYGQAPAPGEEI